jgi:hypothetical protein
MEQTIAEVFHDLARSFTLAANKLAKQPQHDDRSRIERAVEPATRPQGVTRQYLHTHVSDADYSWAYWMKRWCQAHSRKFVSTDSGQRGVCYFIK